MTRIRTGPCDVRQHDVEIQQHCSDWTRKPRLREVYRRFHESIASVIDRGRQGLILELGSGIGAIKEVIPDCVTSDLFPNPWLDRQENAYALSVGDGSVSNLILFDVWHHLRFPGTALREFHRVLAPRGRLILFEPALGWAGWLVYRFFHHEPVGLDEAVTWEAPAGFSPGQADYFAAQGSATRLFWWGEAAGRLDGWRVREVRPIAAFAYLATGGFSGPQIGGPRFHALMGAVDRVANRFPRTCAARLLVVLERQ